MRDQYDVGDIPRITAPASFLNDTPPSPADPFKEERATDSAAVDLFFNAVTDVFVERFGAELHMGYWDDTPDIAKLGAATDRMTDRLIELLDVSDTVIDDERRVNASALLMSLTMIIETPQGSEYTGADCCGWMRVAGFTQTYAEHLVGPNSMVVGIK
jgi:hypothetical protein